MRNSGLRLVASVLLLIIGVGCAGKSPELSSGIIYLRQEDYEKAAEMLQKAVELDPENWEGHFQLAIAYTELHRYRDAHPEFQRAKELNPKKANDIDQRHYAYWYDHFMPGVTALKGSEYEDAATLFNEAIEIDPERTDAYSNLGFAYHRLGKVEESLDAYQSVVKIDPENVDALLAMADVQAELKRFQEANQTLQRILEIDPGRTECWLAIAENCKAMDDLEGGLAAYLKAAEAMPDDAAIPFGIAVIHFKQKNFADAATYFQKAADVSDPSDDIHLDALFNQAQMQAQLEDYEGAKETMLRLIEIKGDSPEYWDMLGRIYFQLGDQEKGMECFEKAKQLEEGK
jgi:tetratricopeptide (TPR) repeat protein